MHQKGDCQPQEYLAQCLWVANVLIDTGVHQVFLAGSGCFFTGINHPPDHQCCCRDTHSSADNQREPPWPGKLLQQWCWQWVKVVDCITNECYQLVNHGNQTLAETDHV